MFKAELDYRALIQYNTNDKSLNHLNPHYPQLSQSGKDQLHYRKSMQEHDEKQFLEATNKEISDFNEEGVWEIVPKLSIPPYTRLLCLIWSFKRKRSPTGKLFKHKDRMCVHGEIQIKGIYYWNTYIPVVNWGTIRLILTMAEIAGRKSQHIDYVLAFFKIQ